MNYAKGINSDNDPLDLDNDELTDSQNMCADDYPIIRTRNDRVLSSLPQLAGTLHGIGQRANIELHNLTSNTWSYGAATDAAWTNISTAVSEPNTPSFIEFNTQTAKYTIMAYSTGVVFNNYWDGATFSTFTDANCPKSNLFTAHRNRVYGVGDDGRTLKYSALGDLTDWTTADDAGYIDITEAKGAITAITTFADHVVIWTDNSMHELYGTGPDNFELVNVSHKVGCASRFAYTEVGGRLYWMDYSGIYMYTGGLPRKIADKADGIIDSIPFNTNKADIRAGGVDNKIYFAIPYGSTNIILVVDMVEDSKRATYAINKEDGIWDGFAPNNEKLYGLRSDGYIYDMHSTQETGEDNSTAISWSMETRPITDEIDKESAVREIWIQHSGTTKATMTFSYTTNDNSTTFTQIAASSDFRHMEWSVRKRVIPSSTQLQGMSFMKFRYAGTGQKKISGTLFNIISYGEE